VPSPNLIDPTNLSLQNNASNGFMGPFQKPAAGFIRLVYVDPIFPGHIHVVNYSMVTDAYGVPDAGFTLPANGTFRASCQVASGDVYVFFGGGTGSGSNLFYRVFSGGVWGPQTVFTPSVVNVSNEPGFVQAIVDQNNLIHVIYFQHQTNILSPTIMMHGTLSTGGVVNLGQVILADAGAPSGFISTPVLWNGQIAFGYFSTVSPFPVGVWFGNPATSITPVWTFEQVDTTLPNTDIDQDEYLVVDNSGNLNLFWNTNNSPTVISVFKSTRIAGVWSAPALFYDAVANPVPGVPAASQFIFSLSAAQLASGAFGIVTALSQNGATDAGYYVGPGGAGNPLYVTLFFHEGLPISYQIRIFKSADGITWTEQDAAHAPATAHSLLVMLLSPSSPGPVKRCLLPS
jgi:hypothetical protein